MKTDIEIASAAKMMPITQITQNMGIKDEFVTQYGNHIAKIDLKLLKEIKNKKNGRLILVTGVTPTSAGEGKTTITIGLAQALSKLGESTVVGIREPSLGPIFGVKGGAAGGGYSQVVPMENINLHFTGDFHAVGVAHNLLAAMIDNSIQHGNPFDLDPRKVIFRRVLDMNDRTLRQIIVGVGGVANGVIHESGFDITATSEVMAIICLATSYKDLKERLARIVVGYTFDGMMITAGQLKADGAMSMLLRDAMMPNIVQTIENIPAFVHGGPFANIAHGCSSLISTKMGMKFSDYFVTEAGFASELGAEKFLNIVCNEAGISPSAVVIVVTIRALKMHGGVKNSELELENIEAVKKGTSNLEKHLENIAKFGIPAVVAINTFPSDTCDEINALLQFAESKGISIARSDTWEKGGIGGVLLAKKVIELSNKKSTFTPLYKSTDDPIDKITTIAKEMYGASEVIFMPKAKKDLKLIIENGLGNLYICMAKTQGSLSDNPRLLGRPQNFSITIREVRLQAGAGLITPIAGEIMTMPGLPKNPSAEGIGMSDDGELFWAVLEIATERPDFLIFYNSGSYFTLFSNYSGIFFCLDR